MVNSGGCKINKDKEGIRFAVTVKINLLQYFKSLNAKIFVHCKETRGLTYNYHFGPFKIHTDENPQIL